MTRDDDGRTVRIWPCPDLDTTPAEYAEGLAEWLTIRPEFVAPSALVHELLTQPIEGARTPRWQLPDEQAELWTPDAVIHPAGWRSKPEQQARQFDRFRAHLSSITQANVAPLAYGEMFAVHGADAPVSRQVAGMYRIEVPAWSSPLPSPVGNTPEGSEGWVTAELMRLYHERGVEPRIIEAHLAPVHRVAAIHRAAEQIKAWLVQLDGRPARKLPKATYQAFAGSIKSQHNRNRHGRVFRPDWGQAIVDCSWANVCRAAYRVHAADDRFVPLYVNVDALYYPPELGTPPGLKLGELPGGFREVVAA